MGWCESPNGPQGHRDRPCPAEEEPTEEKMEREIDERLLARIWRGQWIEASRLETTDGRRLQVVFPGRANGDSGPDFLGAIVALENGRLLVGDVELHVRSRDWITHGHHRDPAYNGVVLHVIWMSDTLWTRREDGVEVATVPLKGRLSLPVGALVALDPSPEETPPFYTSCRRVAQALGMDRMGSMLDLAGEARFKNKGIRFQGELACWPPGEVLYQGLLEALGYTKNQEPFLHLGRLLPYSTLEGLGAGLSYQRRPVALAAWLLGTAGLLPSQSPDEARGPGSEDVKELEAIWRNSPLSREMKEARWHTRRIRPANHPRSRIMGAAHLMARFLDAGLLEGMERVVLEASRAEAPCSIEEGLMVPRYLGRERAREMAVNVVLPFFWALGQWRSDPLLCDACLRLFGLVAGGRGNRVTRQMALQLFEDEGPEVINSARRQQGLIHLFKGPCRYGCCASCPLGLALADREVAAAPVS